LGEKVHLAGSFDGIMGQFCIVCGILLLLPDDGDCWEEGALIIVYSDDRADDLQFVEGGEESFPNSKRCEPGEGYYEFQ
jgi:hypothetical protein